ncbi:12492_t:CDS:2, partial [Funneliformis geosporum]
VATVATRMAVIAYFDHRHQFLNDIYFEGGGHAQFLYAKLSNCHNALKLSNTIYFDDRGLPILYVINHQGRIKKRCIAKELEQINKYMGTLTNDVGQENRIYEITRYAATNVAKLHLLEQNLEMKLPN